MTVMAETDPPVAFDPFEPGYATSPFDQFSRLRQHDPVHWSDLLSGWVLTRYADVVTVLRDATISSDLDNALPSPVVDDERIRLADMQRESATLVLRDDPDHARLRRLMQQPFGPRAIETLRPMITKRVALALDGLVTRGQIDAIADYAYPLPVGVFCEMLGVPTEDSDRFRDWTSAVARNLDPVMDPDERSRNLDKHDEMCDYLEALAEQKRDAPADDILTTLVQAEDAGDRMSHAELVAQLVTLYVAGHEPTTSVIGTGLMELIRHPDQLAWLRDDPDRIGNAVLEFLRFDGPNQFVRRIATQPMRLANRDIAPGQVIYAGIAAANRDPEQWGADADQLRLDRPNVAQHLQFGHGVHSCLGSHLARLQAEIALDSALDRLVDIRLAGDPVWSERMVLRGLESLPISFRTN